MVQFETRLYINLLILTLKLYIQALCHISVAPRENENSFRIIHNAATKANPAKAGGAKPQVFHFKVMTAGLPNREY